MSFGPRKAITDWYDQSVQVDVDEGDADVCLSITNYPEGIRLSSLSADDADNLADQLKAAAAHARTLTPHE